MIRHQEQGKPIHRPRRTATRRASFPFGLLAAVAVTIIAIVVVAYLNRVRIKEAYRAWTAPSLPIEEPYRPPTTTPSNPETPTIPSSSGSGATSTDDGSAVLPSEKRLAVPFTSQAPTANWDAVHEETCEEASVIMAAAYYHGESGRIDPTEAERRIQEVLKFETDNYGSNQDTSATETKRFLEGMYPDLSADVVPVTDADSIKQYIAQGLPVIIPANGKTLPNPNFRNGGPTYHMLVVRGYTSTDFITNDPGTRLGENFLYTYDGLLNSIHDWNGGDVPNGARVMLVIRKK